MYSLTLAEARANRVSMPRACKVLGSSTLKVEADWLRKTLRTSEAELLKQRGLDSYSFLRFLRLILQTYISLAIINIPILFPLSYIHGKGSFQGVQGLDRLMLEPGLVVLIGLIWR